MLVLSRKIGEKIHIGDDVTIEVRRVAGNRVTLAIEAPKNVRILRGELKEAVVEFEEEGHGKVAAKPALVLHNRISNLTPVPHVLG
jgi:carbon storage regulator